MAVVGPLPSGPGPLVSVEQLEVRMGYKLPTGARPQAEDILRAASNQVRELAASSGVDWSAADHVTVLPTAAREVVISATRRELDNPRRVTSRTETTGPFSLTERLSDGEVGSLLTPGERHQVLLAIGAADDSAVTQWSGTLSVRGPRR